MSAGVGPGAHAGRRRHRHLIIGSLPPPVGGTTVALAGLVDALRARADLEVDVVDTSPGSPAGRGPAAAWSLAWRIIRGVRAADSVALHASVGALLGASPLLVAACRLLGRPLLLRGFGGDIDTVIAAGPRWRALPFLLVGMRADVMLCETKRCLEYFRPRFRGVLAWFPNSRPPAPGRAAGDRAPGGVLRVVFVGHVRREKGIGELVAAVERLQGLATLDIYGPVYPDVPRQDLDAPHVRHHGPVEPAAVAALLPGYDVLALPTYYPGEGYPGVILEAYGAGLPVITSRWQCIPEIAGTDCAVLVEPRDVDALVEAVRAVANPETHRRLAEGARRRAGEFRSDRWTGFYLDVVMALAEGTAVPSSPGKPGGPPPAINP